jgi:hypothetical protein
MSDGGPLSSSTLNDPGDEVDGETSPLGAPADSQAPGPGHDHSDQSTLAEQSGLQSRIAELELRLRERVEENIVLDHEVRCLQRERLIDHEYIASLQHDAALFPTVERDLWETKRELEEVRTELEAFRNRRSRILIDRVVVSAQRYPGVYRVGRYVTRRTVRTFQN